MLVIIAAVVVVGFIGIQTTYLSAHSVVYRYYPAFNLLSDVDRSLHYAHLALSNALQSTASDERDAHLKEYSNHVQRSAEAFASFEDIASDLLEAPNHQAGYLREREAWLEGSREALATSGVDSFMKFGEALRSFAAMRTELDRIRQLLRPLLQRGNDTLMQKVGAAQGLLVSTLVVAMLIGGSLATVGVRAIRKQHESMLTKGRLKRERRTQRRALDRRFRRALELARDESDTWGTVADTLRQVLSPARQASLLITDADGRHVTPVFGPDEHTSQPPCGVAHPNDCPAMRRNLQMKFPSSAVFDACPRLRQARGRWSALCIPMSIMGRTSGVLSVTGPENDLPTKWERKALSGLVDRFSAEIGVRRGLAAKEHEANTDPLTGLDNRRRLEAQLPEITAAEHYAVAYIDLDRFKRLNDTHGHDAGDRALQLFADVLRKSLRPEDYAARWGGEEFIVVLPQVSGDNAVAIVERIRTALAERQSEGTPPTFTASFGVSDSRYGTSFELVLSVADGALQCAKQEGRDRIVYRAFPGDDVEPAQAILEGRQAIS